MVAEINRGPKFLYAPYTQISIDFCAKSCFWYKLTTGVWEQLTKKQLLRPKLSGVRARTATRSGLGPQPYLSLQPLKLATLNLVYGLQHGFRLWGIAYQEITFRTKICSGLVYGSIQKIGPLLISLPLKLATSNLEHNLGFGSRPTLQLTTLVPNLVGAGCATEAPQKL